MATKVNSSKIKKALSTAGRVGKTALKAGVILTPYFLHFLKNGIYDPTWSIAFEAGKTWGQIPGIFSEEMAKHGAVGGAATGVIKSFLKGGQNFLGLVDPIYAVGKTGVNIFKFLKG